jgi:hypothetical protein
MLRTVRFDVAFRVSWSEDIVEHNLSRGEQRLHGITRVVDEVTVLRVTDRVRQIKGQAASSGNSKNVPMSHGRGSFSPATWLRQRSDSAEWR